MVTYLLGICCARWLSRPRALGRHPAKRRRADRGFRAGEEVRRTELGDVARRRRRGRVSEAVPVLAGTRRRAGVAVELAAAQRARIKLAELRAAHDLPADDDHSLVADGHGLQLWTFAGGRANNLLGRMLEAKLGPRSSSTTSTSRSANRPDSPTSRSGKRSQSCVRSSAPTTTTPYASRRAALEGEPRSFSRACRTGSSRSSWPRC